MTRLKCNRQPMGNNKSRNLSKNKSRSQSPNSSRSSKFKRLNNNKNLKKI